MTGLAAKAKRIGLNIMWLVPGVVGGSEEYTTGLLSALAESAPPDLHFTLFVNRLFAHTYPEVVASYATVVGPVSGENKARRVFAETTWLGWESRRLGIEVMHHMGGILPMWRPTPTVLTIHDLQPLAMPGHFTGPKRLFSAFTIPRSVRAARHIVTLTEFTRRDMVERLGVDDDRIVVVPPGFDLPPSSLSGTAESVRDIYRLADRPFFLFPAKTWPHKNHEMLLRAFARLHARRPEPMLVLTGGEDQTEERVRELIRELGIGSAVRRTGRVPAEHVDALYRGATALTFPSLYEGFGLPVLEAMSRGCPVIAADATALPEVVGDAGLLVAPNDIEEWGSAMERVLDDRDLRDRLIAAGHRRAHDYDWSEAAAVLADVYRRAPRP